MFLPEQLPALRRQIHDQAARDFRLLEDLVAQAHEMAPGVRPIRPRAATSVALTAADGGNNTVAFNPFSLQIIRVVDSAGKELFLDVVSLATDIDELGRRHLAERTALGELMVDLGVTQLTQLSPIMAGRSRQWVEVYRDLCEWATLYAISTSSTGSTSGCSAGGSATEDSPFVSWVKEGRKYGLGAVLVTQQPGSIPAELLSQGDTAGLAGSGRAP